MDRLFIMVIFQRTSSFRNRAGNSQSSRKSFQKTLEDIEAYVEKYDEKGNIEVEITKKQWLYFAKLNSESKQEEINQIKEVAASNIGQCLDCLNYAESLNLPITLEILVKKFENTYSGDYIIDSCENWNRLSWILL